MCPVEGVEAVCCGRVVGQGMSIQRRPEESRGELGTWNVERDTWGEVLIEGGDGRDCWATGLVEASKGSHLFSAFRLSFQQKKVTRKSSSQSACLHL